MGRKESQLQTRSQAKSSKQVWFSPLAKSKAIDAVHGLTCGNSPLLPTGDLAGPKVAQLVLGDSAARAESRPKVEARLWGFPASGRGLSSSLWVEAPAGSPSSRNAGHLGVSVHNVLLISSSSDSTAWPAPRPGGRRPWAPHTHRAQRTHNSHPKALLLLSLTPRRAPPSRPSPACSHQAGLPQCPQH